MSDRGWVVVTGAASGIGAACASTFRSAGYSVLGVDRVLGLRSDEELELDLAAPDCGLKLEEGVGDKTVVGLVNCAAVSLDRPASEATSADFDQVIAVNLRAPLLLARHLYQGLARHAGFVVNVASVHAVATASGVAVYAASKGGLVALTRALAVEWAPDVRVNAVLPGAVDSPMLASGLSRTGRSVDELGHEHPMGRVGTPTEIADAILFLAQSGFTTGATLIVDGGATSVLSTETRH